MYTNAMDHDYLLTLRREHPAWSLLCADSGPLIISFLHRVFVAPNARALARPEIEEKLEDHLHSLRRVHGEDRYPRSARAYLDDWASGEHAFLRKYYPPSTRGDEPEYDLTPASEKAIEWLKSLEQREFVGTESRLLTVIQLLRQIADATETDARARIVELERQRAVIDATIERLRDGQLEPYDPTQLKERYYQVEDTARRLLADFRQVEENFRQLDRDIRERIATAEVGKGELLEEIFGARDTIANSDQGRSFSAFWRLVMSPGQRDELVTLIEKLLALDEVGAMAADSLLARLNDRLLEAGERVQQTSAVLVEQLRRYLDDQVWLENKRIVELVCSIEKHAVDIRQVPPNQRHFATLSDLRPGIRLPLARTLFTSGSRGCITEHVLRDGEAETDIASLYDVHYVDETELRGNIESALRAGGQVALDELCRQFPIRRGLSEVVTYLHIADGDAYAHVSEAARSSLEWCDANGTKHEVDMPQVIFSR